MSVFDVVADKEEKRSKTKTESSVFDKVAKRYTIEEDENFKNIPEDDWATKKPNLQTVDSTTGKQVQGRKAFNQFVPDETKLINAPKPEPRSFGQEILGSFGKGTQTGIAGLAGLPVDVTTGAMNLLPGVNIQNPVGGSQSIQNAMSGITGDWKPQGATGKYAAAIGEQVPSLAAPMLNAAKQGKTAMGIGKEVAKMLPSTLGAGAGVGTAREFAPNSGAAEIAGGMAGGMAGSIPYLLSQSAKQLPNIVKTRLGRAAPISGQAELGPAHQQQATAAVESMVHKARELPDKGFSFMDESGKVTRHGLPETVEEAWQALPQAKANVYEKYNAKQKAAGAKGLEFSGNNINKDIEAWAKQPDLPPSIADAQSYLNRQMRKYSDKVFTPQQIENEIAAINARLKADFKNPQRSKISHATVDSQLVKILNKQLDDSITRLEGEGYGDLRKEYGSLKAIEDRMTRAAITQQNKLAKSAPDWLPKGWDMGWMLEMMGAASSGHPSAALAGAAAIGGPRIKKWYVDPDRNIKAMFKEADKVIPPRQIFGFGERTFEKGAPRLEQPIYEGEIIPPDKQLARPVSGLLTSPRAEGTVNAPWNPNLRTGKTPAGMTNIQEPPKTGVDLQAMSKQLYSMGFPPSEIQDMIQQEIQRRGGK